MSGEARSPPASSSAAPSHTPRSVAWRVSLGQLARHDAAGRQGAMAEQRARYAAQKRTVLQAPDGSMPEGFTTDDDEGDGVRAKSTASTSQLAVNNPLSLSDDNPWHAHFDKLAALEQIQKDVQRAFPDDEARFRGGVLGRKGEQQLASVLAVWSMAEANANVGYRQGMHELAAVCWLVVKEDAEQGMTLIRLQDVEADAFLLFDALMQRAARWYVWRSGLGTSALTQGLPIHQHCDVVDASLASNDIQLSKHLARLDVSTQLFAVRWIRLLLLREMPLTMALALWEALFDLDPSLHLVDHVCVAMLQRIRGPLLAADDNSTALRLVLSYPIDAVFAEAQQPEQQVDEDAFVHTLLDEARQAHRRHAAVLSGRERVGILPPSSSSGGARLGTTAAAGVGSYAPASLTDLARGIYTQAVAPNLSRAVYNVQRTVNAAYQAHAQSNATAHDGFPPSVGSALVGPRPSGSHRAASSSTIDDAQTRLDTVLTTNRQMGTTLDEVVRVLEGVWPELAKDEADEQRQVDLVVSLTALKHMRDVLSGRVSEFDPAAAVGRGSSADVQAEGSTNARPSASPPVAPPAASSYPPPPPPSAPPSKDRTFGSRFQRTTDDDALVHASTEGDSDEGDRRKAGTVRVKAASSLTEAKTGEQSGVTGPPTAAPRAVPATARSAASDQPRRPGLPFTRRPEVKQPTPSPPARKIVDDPLGASGL